MLTLNLLAIERAGLDVILDVREQRRSYRKIGWTLEIQEPGKRAAKTAGIDHEPRPVLRLLTGRIARRDLRRCAPEKSTAVISTS